MSATIKELSKRCGLSVSAVSKALNGYPDVSEKTRKLVMETAREMGYFPNALARGLKTNRTFNLGVILDDTTNDSLLHGFFIVILNGFRKEAENRGYDITLISRNFGVQNLSYLDHCRYRNVDGVCLMCVNFEDPEVSEMAQSAVPLVTIDHEVDGKDCIFSDNRSGMRDLLRHVLERGHRRIAFLHGTPSKVTDERLGAFYEVMEEQGLFQPPEYVFETYYQNTETEYVAMQKLLALPERPTCVLLTDDYSALGGIDAILQAGLSIPEDISIVGYDGNTLLQKTRPRLTTLRQDGEEMGKRAAIRLINRIEKPDTELLPPEYVRGKLLVGETVAVL